MHGLVALEPYGPQDSASPRCALPPLNYSAARWYVEPTQMHVKVTLGRCDDDREIERQCLLKDYEDDTEDARSAARLQAERSGEPEPGDDRVLDDKDHYTYISLECGCPVTLLNTHAQMATVKPVHNTLLYAPPVVEKFRQDLEADLTWVLRRFLDTRDDPQLDRSRTRAAELLSFRMTRPRFVRYD